MRKRFRSRIDVWNIIGIVIYVIDGFGNPSVTASLVVRGKTRRGGRIRDSEVKVAQEVRVEMRKSSRASAVIEAQ